MAVGGIKVAKCIVVTSCTPRALVTFVRVSVSEPRILQATSSKRICFCEFGYLGFCETFLESLRVED